MTLVELLLLTIIAAPIVVPFLILAVVIIEHRRRVAVRARFERELARAREERMKRGRWVTTEWERF